LANIQNEGSVEHRRGNDRPQKIKAEDNVAIGQWIRRNNEITAKKLLKNFDQLEM
jgi:hypothetical protein